MPVDATYPQGLVQRRQDGSMNVPAGVALSIAGQLKGDSAVPTIGSPGSGVSALSVVAGSTTLAGAVNATLTAVAIGAVVGVVAFAAAAPTAPLFVQVSVASGAGTTGVAIPPVIGWDTATTGGFTLRYVGPNPAATTAAYVITYTCFF